MVCQTTYTSYYITIQNLSENQLLLKLENAIATEENQIWKYSCEQDREHI